MANNYTATHVASQLSTPPTLLFIPQQVAHYFSFNPKVTVITPEFLNTVCDEDLWLYWYEQQLRFGDLTPLIALMPTAFYNLAQSKKYTTNKVTNTTVCDTDTTALEVTINIVTSTKADSQYIAMFNMDISTVSEQELQTVLSGGLLQLVGVDVYARVNRGNIFKQSLLMA